MLLFKPAEEAGVGGMREPQFRITPQRRGVEKLNGAVQDPTFCLP